MLAPHDREYRRILESRRPAYPLTNRIDVFTLTTRYLLQDLLSLLVNTETKVEGQRQRLNKMIRFSPRGAFEKIDRLDKAYISETDVGFY